jgi:hypothetical protein
MIVYQMSRTLLPCVNVCEWVYYTASQPCRIADSYRTSALLRAITYERIAPGHRFLFHRTSSAFQNIAQTLPYRILGVFAPGQWFSIHQKSSEFQYNAQTL